LGGSEDETG
jgi:hypothetical protein